MQKSPYKFLDSYSKEDRDIFFGRDKEIEELYSRIFESRILIVYGTSGTGKSSLINCGLANKFNDSDWLPVGIRRGTNINRSLIDSLAKAALTVLPQEWKKQSGDNAGNILRIIRSIYLDHFKPVFLIFDQFEELFIFGSADEKDELIASIKNILDSDLQCRFIFSIREEYLAGLTEFEKIIPSFLANRIRIEKMTRQNATKVIEGPCKLNHIAVEKGFPEKLLGKLNPDTPEVELTWLQVYLDRIFQLASKDGGTVNFINNDLLESAGEVKDLLGSFLEEQISQLDDPELGLVMLKTFVSVKGTRLQITEDEIIAYSRTLGRDLDREKVRSLIQKFIRLRILRDKDQNDRYELRHDSLAAKIFETITLVEKELLEIRQFLDNAYNNYEKRELYLTAEDLKYIAPYEDKLILNEKISKFISQSKWVIHRVKRRRQNILISMAGTLIVILSFFTVWALKEKSNAYTQKQLAEEQETAAIIARNRAETASQEALRSRIQAVKEKRVADSSFIVARQNEEDALIQRKLALEQKIIAEKNASAAEQQKQIADSERLKAEQEKIKAVQAEIETRRLGFLSTAQNLALKSSGVGNDTLTGLLAVQAYNFNKKYGGRSEDPIIYEALTRAYSDLDSSHHSVFTGSPNEIRIIRENDSQSLITADLDGYFKIWTDNGTDSNLMVLPFQSPVNYIDANKNGDKIITQHDNLDLLIWNTVSSDGDLSSPQELKGHKGFVRALGFTEDEKYMATAGRDSNIIVWANTGQSYSGIRTLKTSSVARALVFAGNDTVIFALENGNVTFWDIKKQTSAVLYSSESDKPLCLAWNGKKKILAAGCTSGALLLFNLGNNGTAQPDKYLIHDAGIDLIAFDSGYSLFAAASRDKTIKFFDYHEYFDIGNKVSGVQHLKNLNYRVRSMIFTREGSLVAGLSDRSIRIWETSSEKLASLISSIVKRDMTYQEWISMIGAEIPYEKTRNGMP